MRELSPKAATGHDRPFPGWVFQLSECFIRRVRRTGATSQVQTVNDSKNSRFDCRLAVAEQTAERVPCGPDLCQTGRCRPEVWLPLTSLIHLETECSGLRK